MSKQRFLNPFVALVVAAGTAVLLFCATRIHLADLDARLLLILLLSVLIGARLIIHIPRVKGEITVTDTLIFLTMLLYGGEVAPLLAAIATLATSLQLTKKVRVVLFNSAVMTCATFLTVTTLRLCFGPVERSEEHTSELQSRLHLVCRLLL